MPGLRPLMTRCGAASLSAWQAMDWLSPPASLQPAGASTCCCTLSCCKPLEALTCCWLLTPSCSLNFSGPIQP